MVKMPSEVIELIEKQKIIPVATASSNGVPNVAYIGLLKILDNETILIVDNFFNKTKINLECNPMVSLAVYDITTREAYQVKGKVEIVTSGEVYEDMVQWVHAKNSSLPARAAVLIHVEEIYNSKSGGDAGKRIL